MKVCSKCKKSLELNYFNKNKNICKDCESVQRRKYYIKTSDSKKQKSKQYRLLNKDKVKKSKSNYYEKNKNVIIDTNSKYYYQNKEQILNQHKKYEQNKRKIDLNYKLSTVLRRRLNEALKGNFKSGSAVGDLGCSIEELKQYIESRFKPGMSWKNHGLHGWHIDHIVPLSFFDLSDREQLLKACHYTNLQPLWAKENLRKSDKLLKFLDSW